MGTHRTVLVAVVLSAALSSAVTVTATEVLTPTGAEAQSAAASGHATILERIRSLRKRVNRVEQRAHDNCWTLVAAWTDIKKAQRPDDGLLSSGPQRL
jgi:endonuclease III